MSEQIFKPGPGVWSNVPPKTPILPPRRSRMLIGVAGVNDGMPTHEFNYETHADGTVTCEPGYSAIIEDGYILGFSVKLK